MAELRRENAGLKHDVEELKQENAELRRENAGLKHDIKELSDQMDETTRAVLGVRLLLLLLFTLMYGRYRIKSRSIRSVDGYSLTWVAISWLSCADTMTGKSGKSGRPHQLLEMISPSELQ